jgi:hypothetical protein
LDELGIKDKRMVKKIGIKVLWDQCPVESAARAIGAAMCQRRHKREAGWFSARVYGEFK